MKKLFCFFPAVIFSVIMFFSAAFGEDEKISVFFNDEEIASDQITLLTHGYIYVPARSIFEKFGFDVDWNNDKKRIKAKKAENNYVIIMQVNSKAANVCGKDKMLANPPIIMNSRVMVPLRDVADELGMNTSWDITNKRVDLIKSDYPVITQVSKNFIYQNYADNNFWSDSTWEGGKNNYFNMESYLNEIFGKEEESDDDGPGYARRYFDLTNDTHEIGAPLSTSDPISQSYEKRALELINSEREKQKLSPLKWNDGLAEAARIHCEDMAERNFFDHTNPDGKDAFSRIKDQGISYSYAAENIAAGQWTPEAAVSDWINSQGHRENILNPNLTETGIGIAYGGEHGIYWTQCFIGK